MITHAQVLEEVRSAYERPTEQVPVVWDQAIGAYVVDALGKTYVDFTSGIFVVNCGHGHPRVQEAIEKQLRTGILHSYDWTTPVRSSYVRGICHTGGDFQGVHLCSTGSEAIEAAIRIAEDYTGRHSFLAFDGAMHGRTLGARCLMSGVYADNPVSGPETIEVDLAPIEDQHTFKEPGDQMRYAAVFVESYHGWGALFHDPGFMRDVQSYCDRTGALLVMDEIQAGFGRTGKFWGYEHYGVEPDLVVFGKAAANGLPLSGVLSTDRDYLEYCDSLSSTHGGNPVACAAGKGVLETIHNEQLVRKAQEIEYFVRTTLKGIGWPYCGKGAVWAVHLKRPGGVYDRALADYVVEQCAERGLLLLKTGRGTIKIGPPLTISATALIQGLSTLRGVLDSLK